MLNNNMNISNNSNKEILFQEYKSVIKGDTFSGDDSKHRLISFHTNTNSSQVYSSESEVIAYGVGNINSVINNSNDNNNNSNNHNSDNISIFSYDDFNEKYLEFSFLEDPEDFNFLLKEEIKERIIKKMKEGLIPFFIWSKGHKPVFYYGRPETEFSKVINKHAQILKEKDNINLLNNLYYYNNKLIDPKSLIKKLKIKPLSIIKDEQ